jgi:glucose-1-phosphate cytidylyltransferase
MKVIILAGGLGTRLAEETHSIPKPMVEIGGKPIVWHLMNIYAQSGFNEFVLAPGSKGGLINDYFLHYHALNEDLMVDFGNGFSNIHALNSLDWVVHLIDTGLQTMTGGRVKRLKDFIGDETSSEREPLEMDSSRRATYVT